MCISNDECLYSLFVDTDTDISMKLYGVLSTSEPYAHATKPDDEDLDLLERYELQGYDATSTNNKCKTETKVHYQVVR